MAASPSSSLDEHYPIGSVLDGRYRIEAVLGTGGMGRVYRAVHTETGETAAIKVLHADLSRNREAAQRFRREAIASSRLDHPNIVGVRESGLLDDGTCYIAMEVLEGESLGDRLLRDKHIPWSEAIEILRGVLAGLRHAHERGVVHRDIKPDNVFLARHDGALVVKILDFGIAKLYAGSADDPASTRAGLTVGTPAYLSPEQAVGGEITPKTDLYSATVVLYEMLAGRAPFEDKDPLAMLGAHVSRPPPRFADLVPGIEIPERLEAIVQQGLMKSAADRISTAAVYLAMLDKVRGGSEASASGIVGPRATPAPSGRTPTAAYRRTAPSRALAQVALPEVGERIPLTWSDRSGAAIGLVIILAVLVALVAQCTGSGAAPDRDAQLRALVRELETGKTCADRKAAVARLAALHDTRALAPLRAARGRADDSNACLRADADRAIRDLSAGK